MAKLFIGTVIVLIFISAVISYFLNMFRGQLDGSAERQIFYDTFLLESIIVLSAVLVLVALVGRLEFLVNRKKPIAPWRPEDHPDPWGEEEAEMRMRMRTPETQPEPEPEPEPQIQRPAPPISNNSGNPGTVGKSTQLIVKNIHLEGRLLTTTTTDEPISLNLGNALAASEIKNAVEQSLKTNIGNNQNNNGEQPVRKGPGRPKGSFKKPRPETETQTQTQTEVVEIEPNETSEEEKNLRFAKTIERD